jgi:hypothetical protein
MFDDSLTDPLKIKIEILKLRLFLKRRIDSQTGCWCWTGITDRYGRGQIKVGGVVVQVHRLAVSLWRGIVLQRTQLAVPTCKNRLCFHPEHMQIQPKGRQSSATEVKLTLGDTKQG